MIGAGEAANIGHFAPALVLHTYESGRQEAKLNLSTLTPEKMDSIAQLFHTQMIESLDLPQRSRYDALVATKKVKPLEVMEDLNLVDSHFI